MGKSTAKQIAWSAEGGVKGKRVVLGVFAKRAGTPVALIRRIRISLQLHPPQSRLDHWNKPYANLFYGTIISQQSFNSRLSGLEIFALSNMPGSTVEETKKTLVQRFRAWGGTSLPHSTLSWTFEPSNAHQSFIVNCEVQGKANISNQKTHSRQRYSPH